MQRARCWVQIGASPIVYRYVDWSNTVPLQMVEFYLILFTCHLNIGLFVFGAFELHNWYVGLRLPGRSWDLKRLDWLSLSAYMAGFSSCLKYFLAKQAGLHRRADTIDSPCLRVLRQST